MKIKLKNRRIANDLYAIAVIAVILTITFSVWCTTQFYNDQSTRVLSELEDKSLRIKNIFTDDIDYVAYQMEAMGNQLIAGNPNDLNFIYKILSYSKVEHSKNVSTTWNMFSWVNKDALLVADGEAGVLIDPKDLSKRDYIPFTVKEPWHFHIGKPVYGAVSRQWLIPGGMGYTNKKGEYIGSMVFGFEIGSLITKLEGTINREGVSFAILDKNYNIIAQSRNNKYITKDSDIIKHLGTIGLLAVHGVISKQGLFSSEDAYSYFYAADKYPFIIVTTYDKVLAAQEFRSTLFTKIIEFSALVLLLISIIYIIRQRIVKPIIEISAAADKLASGDNSIKVRGGKSYEIRNLALQILKIKRLLNKEQKLRQKQKELLKIIRDSDMEKEMFLRELYHAMNTPLNIVIAGAELLKMKQFGNNLDSYNEYLEMIYNAGRQLESYTTDIINPSKIDIKEVIERCVTLQKKKATETRLKVEVDVPDNIPPILADELRIRQVIISILGQALFCIQDFGTIKVSALAKKTKGGKPQKLIITIEDDGLGVSENERVEQWERAFGNPDQIHTYSRNPDITRLSFAIIRHLVKLHHGTFELKTISGIGSTFIITLPYLTKKELETTPKNITRASIKKTRPDINLAENVIKFPGVE